MIRKATHCIDDGHRTAAVANDLIGVEHSTVRALLGRDHLSAGSFDHFLGINFLGHVRRCDPFEEENESMYGLQTLECFRVEGVEIVHLQAFHPDLLQKLGKDKRIAGIRFVRVLVGHSMRSTIMLTIP